MNQKDAVLSVDMPENQLAIAIGNETPDALFFDTNRVFSAVFPSVRSPGELYGLITNRTDNKTIIEYNDGHWELLEIKINPSDILFLLKNVSFDVLILKQLKKQLSELSRVHKIYTDIMEKELPIGILLIDKNYDVTYANDTLKRIFHIPSRMNLQKCYNYFKNLKPCEDCILEGIHMGLEKKKTFTSIGNRMITSEAHLMGDTFLVTFRDTTKEIYLIKEIKRQHEELQNANRRIAEQNDILKRLSTINIRIGQMKELETILETMNNAIIETFSCENGAVLLFNAAGKIKNAHFSPGIPVDERRMILKSIDSESLKNEPGTNTNTNDIDEKLQAYITQDMKDMMDKEKSIGRLFLYHPEKTIDRSILELFLMQVIVFLQNLELQRKLEEAAHRDALTGVFNRYYFEKQLNEEKKLSMRFGQPLSLIMIDLNGLKQVNDMAGHDAGDRMLTDTANILKGITGALDSIYRIGGDEFYILLSNCPRQRLNSVMGKLKQIQTSVSIEYEGKTFPVRFCMGGACSTDVSHDHLKDEADKRMYADKKDFYKSHNKYR